MALAELCFSVQVSAMNFRPLYVSPAIGMASTGAAVQKQDILKALQAFSAFHDVCSACFTSTCG